MSREGAVLESHQVQVWFRGQGDRESKGVRILPLSLFFAVKVLFYLMRLLWPMWCIHLISLVVWVVWLPYTPPPCTPPSAIGP